MLTTAAPHAAHPADGDSPRLGAAALTTFERVWRTVVNRRYLILAIVAATIVLGFLATLTVVPRYTATTRIEISREQDNVTDVGKDQSDQMVQELTFYQTQYALLNDRSIAERVVRAQRLATDAQFAQAFDLTSAEGTIQPKGAAGNTVAVDRAVDVLLANISVKPVRGSSLVDIQFEVPTPHCPHGSSTNGSTSSSAPSWIAGSAPPQMRAVLLSSGLSNCAPRSRSPSAS